jgi:hypothetical protein
MLRYGVASCSQCLQARPADNDRKKTIVLRFPKGFPLPSQSQVRALWVTRQQFEPALQLCIAVQTCVVLYFLILRPAYLTHPAICTMQLLLAGANSGQLSHKDIYVFSKSYVACLDYNDVQVLMCCPAAVSWSSCLLQACVTWHQRQERGSGHEGTFHSAKSTWCTAQVARKAEHWFVNNVDRHFKVARNETVRVTREVWLFNNPFQYHSGHVTTAPHLLSAR